MLVGIGNTRTETGLRRNGKGERSPRLRTYRSDSVFATKRQLRLIVKKFEGATVRVRW